VQGGVDLAVEDDEEVLADGRREHALQQVVDLELGEHGAVQEQ